VGIAVSLPRLSAAETTELVEQLRTATASEAAGKPSDDSVGPQIINVEDVMAVVLEEGDILELRVFGDDLFSAPKATVEKGGALLLPLLGEVKVAGLTLAQAKAKIHKILSDDYLVDPRLSLNIVEYAKYQFSIKGEVRVPGTFLVPRNQELDVAQAIVSHGQGVTRLGSTKAVVERIVNGQKTTLRVDLGDKRGAPVKIRPKDTITVGERIF
jgi:polysaccharide export outer membrane protein